MFYRPKEKLAVFLKYGTIILRNSHHRGADVEFPSELGGREVSHG
jgi:hypothetical protein